MMQELSLSSSVFIRISNLFLFVLLVKMLLFLPHILYAEGVGQLGP